MPFAGARALGPNSSPTRTARQTTAHQPDKPAPTRGASTAGVPNAPALRSSEAAPTRRARTGCTVEEKGSLPQDASYGQAGRRLWLRSQHTRPGPLDLNAPQALPPCSPGYTRLTSGIGTYQKSVVGAACSDSAPRRALALMEGRQLHSLMGTARRPVGAAPMIALLGLLAATHGSLSAGLRGQGHSWTAQVRAGHALSRPAANPDVGETSGSAVRQLRQLGRQEVLEGEREGSLPLGVALVAPSADAAVDRPPGPTCTACTCQVQYVHGTPPEPLAWSPLGMVPRAQWPAQVVPALAPSAITNCAARGGLDVRAPARMGPGAQPHQPVHDSRLSRLIEPPAPGPAAPLHGPRTEGPRFSGSRFTLHPSTSTLNHPPSTQPHLTLNGQHPCMAHGTRPYRRAGHHRHHVPGPRGRRGM